MNAADLSDGMTTMWQSQECRHQRDIIQVPGAGPNATSLTDILHSFCFLGFPVETAMRGVLSLLWAYVPDAYAPNRGFLFGTPGDPVEIVGLA